MASINAFAAGQEFAAPINAMHTRIFLERAEYYAHYFAGTKPATIMQGGGTNTAVWTRYEHMTPSTTALSELTSNSLPTRNPTVLTRSEVNATLAKYGAFAMLTEEADVYNFNGQTAEIMDVLGENAGRSLNQVMRDEMEDNATQIFANGASAGAVNTIMAVGDVNNVVNALQRNVAKPFSPLTTGSQNIGTSPIMASYWGICHPDVAYDISGFTGFKDVSEYANQVQLVPGEFGYYGRAGVGVRFIQTADADIDADAGGTGTDDVRGGAGASADSADVYQTVIYGQNAVGSLGLGSRQFTEAVVRANATGQIGPINIVNQSPGGIADPLNEVSTMGWKSFMAAKILNANWIRSVVTAASSL